MPDFLPRSDSALLAWSINFDQKINAAPAEYGISAAQAQAFHDVQQAYAAALDVSNAPLTRSRPNIIAKDATRDLMKQEIRRLKGFVDGFSTLADAQRVELGLKLKRTGKAAVIPPPKAAPGMNIIARNGWTVRVRLFDSQVARVGKPPGVLGAILFSFVGKSPPENTANWLHCGQTTKVIFDFNFNSSVPPATTVWLVAHWTSPTGKLGPAKIISTLIAGGALAAA